MTNSCAASSNCPTACKAIHAILLLTLIASFFLPWVLFAIPAPTVDNKPVDTTAVAPAGEQTGFNMGKYASHRYTALAAGILGFLLLMSSQRKMTAISFILSIVAVSAMGCMAYLAEHREITPFTLKYGIHLFNGALLLLFIGSGLRLFFGHKATDGSCCCQK